MKSKIDSLGQKEKEPLPAGKAEKAGVMSSLKALTKAPKDKKEIEDYFSSES